MGSLNIPFKKTAKMAVTIKKTNEKYIYLFNVKLPVNSEFFGVTVSEILTNIHPIIIFLLNHFLN